MESPTRDSTINPTRASILKPRSSMTSNFEDDDEVNATFKTAVDFVSTGLRVPTPLDPDMYKLPPVVNFVALRETFLSEAPFVKRTNRMFWKKWIDSKQYSNALALSLRFITGCISDNGAVNLGKLYQIENSVLIEKLSSNISEMLTLERDFLHHSASHDILFTRLPEVLAYMIINSLLSSLPKLARVYYAAQFRELLLDWLNEVIGGLRLTYARKDREWLFNDATDMPIVVINHTRVLPEINRQSLASHSSSAPSSPMGKKGTKTATAAATAAAAAAKSSLRSPDRSPDPSPVQSPTPSMRKSMFGRSDANRSMFGSTPKLYNAVVAAKEEEKYKRDHDATRFSRATSCFTLENSPLVRMYLNGGRSYEDQYQCQHPLKISLSHVPDRPLVSMQLDSLVKEGTFREKKIDHKHLTQIIKHSTQHREKILKELRSKDHELKRDLVRMKHAYRIQLDILNKKPVTQKQLLAAATAKAKANESS